MKNIISILLLLSSIIVGLGSFGHSLSGVKQIHEELAKKSFDSELGKLVIVVWHLAGVAMFMFGVMLVWAWTHYRNGELAYLLLPEFIGLVYIIYGIASMKYMDGEPFFWVFIVLGILLLIPSLLLFWINKT